MRSGSFTGNSTDHQLDEADERFKAVEQAAREYEQHHARSTELLRSALAELYGFGEALRLQASEPGRSLIGEFVSSRGVPWNLATQRNPYIALVNMTFAPSASGPPECGQTASTARSIAGSTPCCTAIASSARTSFGKQLPP